MSEAFLFSRDGYGYAVEVVRLLSDMRVEVRDVNGKEHRHFIVDREELEKVRAVTRQTWVWR